MNFIAIVLIAYWPHKTTHKKSYWHTFSVLFKHNNSTGQNALNFILYTRRSVYSVSDLLFPPILDSDLHELHAKIQFRTSAAIQTVFDSMKTVWVNVCVLLSCCKTFQVVKIFLSALLVLFK